MTKEQLEREHIALNSALQEWRFTINKRLTKDQYYEMVRRHAGVTVDFLTVEFINIGKAR